MALEREFHPEVPVMLGNTINDVHFRGMETCAEKRKVRGNLDGIGHISRLSAGSFLKIEVFLHKRDHPFFERFLFQAVRAEPPLRDDKAEGVPLVFQGGGQIFRFQ